MRFYYGPPPGGDDGADPRFTSLTARQLDACSRVAIWTTGVGSFAPEALLRAEGPGPGGSGALRGLVVAAPGTGSLSGEVLEQLAAWTGHGGEGQEREGEGRRGVPVVVVSRCRRGNNYDDCYYRGSRDKYERRGVLLGGFEHLNAVQVGGACVDASRGTGAV